MPAAVLTVVLAVTSVPGRVRSFATVRTIVALVALTAAASQVPARLVFSATLHKMPEYGPLVEGSRRVVRQRQAMRGIETEFTLPAPSDPLFVYRILGGRTDPASPWIARIRSTGAVEFRKID
jgi:hypothetical protein